MTTLLVSYSKPSQVIVSGPIINYASVVHSSLKLHNENNACMLCASVSCWAGLFLQHLRSRSLWIISETDDRRIPPPHVKFLWLFGGSDVCLSDSATATQLCRRSRLCACTLRLPVDCSELHQSLAQLLCLPLKGKTSITRWRNVQGRTDEGAKHPVVLYTWPRRHIKLHSGSTLCLKKRPNFETVSLEILRTDFDDIWQKYSKVSRIEFACFSFHVGLLFITLSWISSVKLHNENNACMLCASVSC